MKTVRHISIAILVVAMMASTASSQETSVGMSPVYIPATQSNTKNSIKSVETFQPASAVRKSSIAGVNDPSPISPANSYSGDNCSCNSGGNNRIGGCGCGGGCDGGCGGGCQCQSGGGCDGGCQCGGHCGCGGCQGNDRVGRSFFGQLADLSPIRFSVNGGDGGCGNGCQPGECNCNCRYLDGLSRILPVSVRICSNHCSRYISVFAGYYDLEDFDGVAGGTTLLTEFNDGWQAGFAMGRRFPGNLRLESEFSIRHHTNDTVSTGMFVGPVFVPAAVFDAVDSIYSVHSMRNLLYDFNGLGGKTIPYVGAGAGGMFVDGDIVTPGLGRVDFIDDTAFAYQLIAGVTRRFNCCSEAYAEFRYFGTSGVDVETAVGMPFADPEFDFQSNQVIFGFRMTRRGR
jgi:opacity protein-like surface antigen